VNAVLESSRLTLSDQLKKQGSPLLISPARRLITPRRLDLIVKWRFFRHLLGGDDPNASTVYRWHIAKRRASGFVDAAHSQEDESTTLDHYEMKAKKLLESMTENGFDERHPIPIDPNNELLGGAHRLACAIAMDLPVYVEKSEERVWAPAWGIRWFLDAGMDESGTARLLYDYDKAGRGLGDG